MKTDAVNAVEVFRRATAKLDDSDPFKPMAEALLAQIDAFAGPTCSDEDCPDYDGNHPHHFNAVEQFWRRVEDTYRGRSVQEVPAVATWREDLHKLEVDVADLRSTCAMLRAQAEAARKVAADELDRGARTEEAAEVAAEVLLAMEEAKPVASVPTRCDCCGWAGPCPICG